MKAATAHKPIKRYWALSFIVVFEYEHWAKCATHIGLRPLYSSTYTHACHMRTLLHSLLYAPSSSPSSSTDQIRHIWCTSIRTYVCMACSCLCVLDANRWKNKKNEDNPHIKTTRDLTAYSAKQMLREWEPAKQRERKKACWGIDTKRTQRVEATAVAAAATVTNNMVLPSSFMCVKERDSKTLFIRNDAERAQEPITLF